MDLEYDSDDSSILARALAPVPLNPGSTSEVSTSDGNGDREDSIKLGKTIILAYAFLANRQAVIDINKRKMSMLRYKKGNNVLKDLQMLAEKTPSEADPEFKLLITDSRLRDMLGYKLIESVIKEPGLRKLPFVILSVRYASNLKNINSVGTSETHILLIESNKRCGKDVNNAFNSKKFFDGKCKVNIYQSSAKAVEFLNNPDSGGVKKVKMVIAEVGLLGNEADGYAFLNTIRGSVDVPIVVTIPHDVKELAFIERVIGGGAVMVVRKPFEELYAPYIIPVM